MKETSICGISPGGFYDKTYSPFFCFLSFVCIAAVEPLLLSTPSVEEIKISIDFKRVDCDDYHSSCSEDRMVCKFSFSSPVLRDETGTINSLIWFIPTKNMIQSFFEKVELNVTEHQKNGEQNFQVFFITKSH